MGAAFASVMLLTSVSACGVSSEPEGETAPIVIAADLELSGAAAQVGTAYERALRLKVEQVNAGGGILDGRQIELRIEDNRSDATLALSNVSNFAEDPSVTAVITGACSECAVAAAKAVETAQLPTVSLAPANDVTNPVTERRFMFKVGPNPTDNAALIVAELRSVRSRKIGLLTTDDMYGDGGKRAIQNELRNELNAQMDLVADRQFKATDTDVAQPVQQVVEEDPDAIVVWALSEQAGKVAAEARAAGFTGDIFFDSGAAGDLFLSGPTADATNGTTMIFTQTMTVDDVIATTPGKTARKQWFRDYTSRYGSYFGPSSFAADAVQVIVSAIERVGSADDPEAIRSAIEFSQFDGLSGPIRITPANHSGLMPQALVSLVARTGRWRLKI
nr:ABC transporter substrate-binding protein [Micromonospora sp. DSM 115978]